MVIFMKERECPKEVHGERGVMCVLFTQTQMTLGKGLTPAP